MLNINDLSDELHELTAWQETPEPLGSSDYQRMVSRAIRKFFVLINHPDEYNIDSFIEEDGQLFYDHAFKADEIEFILVLCKVEFFKRVQSDVNNAFGYTTNALTVTNADKPYANLKNTLSELYDEVRILFNKMVRYTLGES